MDKFVLRLVMVLALGVFGVAGVGCGQGADDEGPLEEAGKGLDEAGRDAGEAMQDASDKASREIDEAQREADDENP